MGAVIDGMALREKVRKEERNLANIDNESFLTSLEDDKPLIPPKPRNSPMTESFLPKVDSD